MKNKILLFTRPLAPPWDEASKNLAFDIAKSSSGEFDFHALTTSEYAKHLKEKEFELTKKITPEGIFISASFNYLEKIILLLRLFKINLNADIVHFLFTPRKFTSMLIRTRLAFSKAKTVQTIATLPDSLFQNQKSLKSALFANKIVAQSENTANRLKKHGFSNVEVIYPGINIVKFSPKPKNHGLMQRFQIENDDFVILFAGEYTRLKAIDDIIDAFEIILKSKSDSEKFKLILACRIKSPEDKKKKTEIIEKTKKLGYHKYIVFIDTFADMPSLYNMSDVNIFPVREMTGKFDIPLALIEAMACKKPVIISDIPVLEEFVKNEETGLVIPKNDPEKLALSIFSLSRNQEKLNNLAHNAFKYVLEQFDINKTTKRYEELYKKLDS